MRKFILPFLAIAAVLSSCGNKSVETNDKYVIVGELSDSAYNGATVYLQKAGDTWSTRRTTIDIDTAIVENGKFIFEGTADSIPVLRYITVTPANVEGVKKKTMLVLEADSIKIGLLNNDLTVSGTELNEKVAEGYELGRKLETAPDSECAPLVYNFIKKNATNPLGELALVDISYFLNPDQLNEVLGLTTSRFRESLFGQVLVKRNDALQASTIGKQFVDVKGNTPDGKSAALSDYAGKGKYVLVDFWASWCPPCRADMPLLVKAYGKYKNKGFEIVGISLDSKNEEWEKGIKNLKITWPQMSDLKGWESELSGAYGISSIPSTVLLDKEGKIIAKNIEGKDLDAKLGELLK